MEGFNTVAEFFVRDVEYDREALLYLCAILNRVYRRGSDENLIELDEYHRKIDRCCEERYFVGLLEKLIVITAVKSDDDEYADEKEEVVMETGGENIGEGKERTERKYNLQSLGVLSRTVIGTLFYIMKTHEKSRRVLVQYAQKDSGSRLYTALLAHFLTTDSAEDSYQVALLHVFFFSENVSSSTHTRKRIRLFQKGGGLVAILRGAIQFYRYWFKKRGLPTSMLEEYLLVVTQLLGMCADEPVIKEGLLESGNVRKGYQALLFLCKRLAWRELRGGEVMEEDERFASVRKIVFALGRSVWMRCVKESQDGDKAPLNSLLFLVDGLLSLLEERCFIEKRWLFPMRCVKDLWTNTVVNSEDGEDTGNSASHESVCDYCFSGSSQNVECHLCSTSQYCSEECLRKHAQMHSKDCLMLRQCRRGLSSESAHNEGHIGRLCLVPEETEWNFNCTSELVFVQVEESQAWGFLTYGNLAGLLRRNNESRGHKYTDSDAFTSVISVSRTFLNEEKIAVCGELCDNKIAVVHLCLKNCESGRIIPFYRLRTTEPCVS